MRLERLKDELNRPVITSDYLKRNRHDIVEAHKPKVVQLTEHQSMNDTKDGLVTDLPPAKELKPSEKAHDKLTKKQATIDAVLEEITTQMPLIEDLDSDDRYVYCLYFVFFL